MNGGTIEVKILHIYFVVSVLSANLFSFVY